MDRSQLKDRINSLVAEKVSLTQERREYKLRTRGQVEEYERMTQFHNIDARRAERRSDIRSALLAYGFLRGKDYKQIERYCDPDNRPDAEAIASLIDSYPSTRADVVKWLNGAHSPRYRENSTVPLQKLFVVVRANLEEGQKAVQACHALREFVAEHNVTEAHWYHNSNTLVLLEVEDEDKLHKLSQECWRKEVFHSQFREPDLGHSLTAITIAPEGKELCQKLPLAMSAAA